MNKMNFDRLNYVNEYNEFLSNDLWPFVEDFLAITNNLSADQAYYFLGNGASAAVASHLANDFSKSLHCRARTFHDPALITCLANDYGYENWLSEAINLYAAEGDVTILISSSGRSKNILNASQMAEKRGCKIVTLTGPNADKDLVARSDCHLSVRSQAYNIIECCHMTALCAAVDSIKMVMVD